MTLRIGIWSSIRLLLSTGQNMPAKADYHGPID